MSAGGEYEENRGRLHLRRVNTYHQAGRPSRFLGEVLAYYRELPQRLHRIMRAYLEHGKNISVAFNSQSDLFIHHPGLRSPSLAAVILTRQFCSGAVTRAA
jgi:hypothetical protein